MSPSVTGEDGSGRGVLVRVADEVHVVGIWSNTLVQIWRGAPTNLLTAEMNRIARAFVASSLDPVISLFVVERGSAVPDDQVIHESEFRRMRQDRGQGHADRAHQSAAKAAAFGHDH